MMRSSLRCAWLGVPVLALVLLASAGCSHGTNAVPVPLHADQSRQQNMNARIQSIQNNPNIPQADKAPLIAQAQQQMAGGGKK